MKLLAIESSGSPASVCLMCDGKITGEFSINIQRTHSEKLMPLIDMLLDTVGVDIKEVDAYAVSCGPGSFTGLRIGMSAAKMMAEVLGKPLIPVGTLDALARNVSVFEGLICAVLDARNNTFYAALWKNVGLQLQQLCEPKALSVQECCRRVKEEGIPVMFCGEFEKYQATITALLEGIQVYFAPETHAWQSAGCVAEIAYEKYMQGDRTLPGEVVPFYLRESQAEQKRKASSGKQEA